MLILGVPWCSTFATLRGFRNKNSIYAHGKRTNGVSAHRQKNTHAQAHRRVSLFRSQFNRNSFSYYMTDFDTLRIWIKAMCISMEERHQHNRLHVVWADKNLHFQFWDETFLTCGPDDRMWFRPAFKSICSILYNSYMCPMSINRSIGANRECENKWQVNIMLDAHCAVNTNLFHFPSFSRYHSLDSIELVSIAHIMLFINK